MFPKQNITSKMSDEEVIKRRLIIDGDGTGDDRRLNVILKILTKWALSGDSNSLENQVLYDRMLYQLALCEFSVKRSQLLTKTMTRQLEKYHELQEKFETLISTAKDSITESKNNLIQAKIWKQNHMMYDLLAQSIDEQPARKETNQMLTNLQTELKELSEESKSLEQKLDLRRKQFHVLVSTANQLRSMLEEMNNEENSINNSLDDITNSPGPEPMSE